MNESRKTKKNGKIDQETEPETEEKKVQSTETIRTGGGLGRNPLESIQQTGLEGLLSGSKKKFGEEKEKELLHTKAVKLTQEDLEFVEDMAIAVKNEGNFSEGIRACIRAARKQYGEEVKKLADQRKSLEVINI